MLVLTREKSLPYVDSFRFGNANGIWHAFEPRDYQSTAVRLERKPPKAYVVDLHVR